MISTWFLFFTFFSNIFITNSIIPYSLKKAQPKLDFFDKLQRRKRYLINAPSAFLSYQ